MQHCKALRTRTWFAISLILVLALFFLGCTTGGGDFTYEGTDTITITKYIGAGGDVIIPSKINGKPVTGIGEYAFYDCDSLTGINIPDSVTIIGDCAFYNCDGLTSVAIPASVTSMGDNDYAFVYCDNLSAINVDTANTMYRSEDGILYNKAKTVLIQYPAGKTAVSFAIPNGVTGISDIAFYACGSLTSITLPASVTVIGGNDYAFPYCGSLTAINVDAANTTYSSEDGILYNKAKTALIQYPIGKTGASFTIPNTVTDIGLCAFSECELSSVIIPNSVTNIGQCAFAQCGNLTGVTIPASVTSIGNGAFIGCDSLTSITIPDSVTSIGDGAFFGCTNLSAINVDTANIVYISDDGILYNKAKTTLVQYPAGKTAASFTIPGSVTSIGYGAFGRTILSSVSIPDNVTGIANNAFHGCYSLANITIPNSVTSIGYMAFGSCASLTSITIPASVTSIDSYAFADCANLESVTFEGTITSDNFGLTNSIGIHSPFDGDLRDKYLNGGSRTYTTTPPVTKSSIWAKQLSILEKLIRMAHTDRSTATREASTL